MADVINLFPRKTLVTHDENDVLTFPDHYIVVKCSAACDKTHLIRADLTDSYICEQVTAFQESHGCEGDTDFATVVELSDDFGSVRPNDLKSPMDAAEIMDLIEQYDSDVVKVSMEILSDADPSGLKTWISENYVGKFDSKEDWAREHFENFGNLDLSGVPSYVRRYVTFDYEAFVRDCESDGSIYFEEVLHGWLAFRNG